MINYVSRDACLLATDPEELRSLLVWPPGHPSPPAARPSAGSIHRIVHDMHVLQGCFVL
jgi:hypothetical protein